MKGQDFIMDEQRKMYGKHESMAARSKLMQELNEGRKSGETEGWISAKDVRNHFMERENKQQ